MTKLRQQMIGELQLRNCSEATIHSYLHAVERFARFFGKSPSTLGCDQVKEFLLHLRNNKKCKWSTLMVDAAGESRDASVPVCEGAEAGLVRGRDSCPKAASVSAYGAQR